MEADYIDFTSSRSYRTCSNDRILAHDHDKTCHESGDSERSSNASPLRWIAPALLWSVFLSATDMSFVLAENSIIGEPWLSWAELLRSIHDWKLYHVDVTTNWPSWTASSFGQLKNSGWLVLSLSLANTVANPLVRQRNFFYYLFVHRCTCSIVEEDFTYKNPVWLACGTLES